MTSLSDLLKQNPGILDLLKPDMGQQPSKASQNDASQTFLARPGIDLQQEKAKQDEQTMQDAEDEKLQQIASAQKAKESSLQNLDKTDEDRQRTLQEKMAVSKIQDEQDKQQESDKTLEDQYGKEQAEAEAPETAPSISEVPGLDYDSGEQPVAVAKPLTLGEQYKALQQHQLDVAKNAEYAKAGNMMLQGFLPRANAKLFEEQRKELDDVNKLPALELKQLGDRIAFQSEDPNSDVSKYVKEMMKKQFGVDIPEGLSATQLEKTTMKPMVQMAIQQLKQNTAMMTLQNRAEQAKMQEEGRNKRSQGSQDRMAQNVDVKKKGLELRTDAYDNKLAQDLKKDLTSDLTGRGTIGQIGTSLSLIGRANALIKKGDLNKLSPIQIRELSTAVARVIQGQGAIAERQIEALTPNTVGSKSAEVTQWLTNNPTGAQQKQFVKLFKDMLDREQEELNKQKGEFVKRILPSHERLKQRNPELYNKILGEQNLTPEMKSDSHPQDSEAIDWAKNAMSSGTPEEKDKALQILKENNIIGQ